MTFLILFALFRQTFSMKHKVADIFQVQRFGLQNIGRTTWGLEMVLVFQVSPG
jgi:hypothetical protein